MDDFWVKEAISILRQNGSREPADAVAALAALLAETQRDFAALQRAIVGDTGASAMLAVDALKARLAEAVAALHGIAHADTEASALRLRFMAADALIAHNTASSAEPREDAAHG